MITFCVDPGTGKNCGIAAFLDGRLISAGLVDGAAPHAVVSGPYKTEPHEPDVWEVVLELPRVYPGTKAKADPNDLIKLAYVGGRVAQVLAGSFPVLCVAPSDWKAQTDPDIMCERIAGRHLTRAERCNGTERPGDPCAECDAAKLTKEERDIVAKVFAAYGKKGMPKSLRHNVIDAIGIGLWRVGRMRPGGAGR